MMKTRLKRLFIGWVVLQVHGVLAEERIDMEAMSIIGNKELPNVLYILPWKPATLPEMVELPLSSLINDALQPIDRQSVLRRQYYKQIIKQQGVVPASLEQHKK